MIQVVLRNIAKCTAEQIQAVRVIRNQDGIRQSMYTEHEIENDEHLCWVERLNSDTSQMVFVVLVDDVVSGVVSVDAVDRLHRKSDWAFYLDANVRGGLGAALEYALLNYVFDEMHLEKLNCEVIETNEAVVKMHKKFGFLEEGFRRENIEKNGKRIGVFFLGLTKTDWANCKQGVLKKYMAIFNKFEIRFEHDTL